MKDPISIRVDCSKNYVDNTFKDHIDFNGVKLDKIKFVKIKYEPAGNEHLTPNNFVDKAKNENSLVTKNQDNDLNKYNLSNINSIILKTKAVNENQVITKSLVDQFYQENEQKKPKFGCHFSNESNDFVKNNQDNDFIDKKLINVNGITVYRTLNSHNKLTRKIYVDDRIGVDNILRFNQRLENHLKVSFRNDVFNLNK